MKSKIATVDFHVTSDCSQDCPYCWGPQDYENPVDTLTALRVISRIKKTGARRIVFTGGDPLRRRDIGRLIQHACKKGLEAAVSTTGDKLTKKFLRENGAYIDLISLPLDGSTGKIDSLTKKKGHFKAVMRALGNLKAYPSIDVKLCTPVTKHNLKDIPNIVRLAEKYARTTGARVFYNVFQTFRRAMFEVDWKELLVTDKQFASLKKKVGRRKGIRVNFLGRRTLDKLYLMIFPDGSLVVPRGSEFRFFGKFLSIKDIDSVIKNSGFDSRKHLKHSRKWKKSKANKNPS